MKDLSGKVHKVPDRLPKDVNSPEDIQEVSFIEMPTPERPARPLVREELDDILRGEDKKPLVDFALSPETAGIKEILKGSDIKVRNIKTGKIVHIDDL